MRPSSPCSDRPQKMDFLVSFLVDARGGSMCGSRRSGVRVLIPSQSAEKPMRLTIRQLRPDQVVNLPPMSEGEGLASRIIHLTPASFLTPVLLEVPHFAQLHDDREILVLRSDNGKKWFTHHNSSEDSHLTEFLNMNSVNNINNNESLAVTSITTTSFPQYFAIISRPRQEQHMIGPEGGDILSDQCQQVECHFPARSLTKPISVGMSVLRVADVYTGDLSQQGGAVSPVVTVEPRRRKFHKPITVTMPLPQENKRTPNIETSLMLMCSMSGAGTRSVWEDVTVSTPLLINSTSAQFSTVVSAQFWLIRLPTWMTLDKLAITDNIFRLASRTPYLAHMCLYWRTVDADDDVELEMRMIVATDGERAAADNNLEEKEGFIKLFSSDKLEFLDKSEIFVKLTGNLETETVPRLIFRPFVENRITIGVRRREPDSTPVGKLEITNDSDVKLHTMPLLFKL